MGDSKWIVATHLYLVTSGNLHRVLMQPHWLHYSRLQLPSTQGHSGKVEAHPVRGYVRDFRRIHTKKKQVTLSHNAP